MKKYIYTVFMSLMLLPVLSASAQKYKTVEDTAKLNKEYVNVSNDIADLSAKLTIAQNDLPGYQAKAVDADKDAANAASSSSNQADKATSGSVGDARSAKRKARKAYNEAKDSRAAKNRLSDHENKITRIRLQLKKKQERLQDLDIMRNDILAKIVIDPVAQPLQ